MDGRSVQLGAHIQDPQSGGFFVVAGDEPFVHCTYGQTHIPW